MCFPLAIITVHANVVSSRPVRVRVLVAGWYDVACARVSLFAAPHSWTLHLDQLVWVPPTVFENCLWYVDHNHQRFLYSTFDYTYANILLANMQTQHYSSLLPINILLRPHRLRPSRLLLRRRRKIRSSQWFGDSFRGDFRRSIPSRL